MATTSVRILGGGLGVRVTVTRAAGNLPPFAEAQLTIAAGEISTDLNDFPVRVNLANLPAGFWTAVAADGSDIKVYDSSFTQLPRDLVVIDTGADTGDLFFKANLLSASDNIFYISAGSGDTAPADNSTYGRNAVWTSYNRAFVFTGNSTDDRTGSGIGLTLSGGAQVTVGTLNTDPATAYAYCSISAFADWHSGLIASGGDPSSNQVFSEYRNSGGTERAQLLYRSGGALFAIFDETNGLLTVATSLSIGLVIDRHFPVIMHDGGRLREGWIDGVRYLDQSIATSIPNSGTEFRLSYPVADGYKGAYELAYFRTAVSVTAWLSAEYNSWFTPSNFYTVSAV